MCKTEKKKNKNETKALFIDNIKTDFLNDYFSYFWEQNILNLNQTNKKKH